MTVKTLSETFPELGETVLDTPIRKLVPSFNFTLSDRYNTFIDLSIKYIIFILCIIIEKLNE